MIAVAAASVYELADGASSSVFPQRDDRREAVEAIYQSWNMAFCPANATAFERRSPSGTV